MARKAVKMVEHYIISRFVLSASDLSNLSSCGIYKIHHTKAPDKIYVGCTAHKGGKKSFLGGFYTRWGHHISQLANGNHSVKSLQEFVNKNGLNGIRFSILEICDDRELSFKKEKEYIDSLNPFYNGAANVYQFDMDGCLIKRHFTGSDAARETNIDRGSINNTCLGNRVSAGGFLWSFKDTVKAPNFTYIEQMDMDGGRIRLYRSYADAAQAMGTCSSNSIRSCMKGNQRHAYGFTWKETKMSAEERREKGLLLTKHETV